MYIDSPIWNLKKECPCCNQHSCLVIHICDNCKKMSAICDECSRTFLDPTNISLDNTGDESSNEDCQHCKAVKGLRPAKDFEIINIGLTPDQYE